ncbi:ImuA family protein [Bradyrhizobium amphicarpaeae]|uniref:DNA repair protein n=1 Tax=Bradyrhizobium amphicarpaeae TaxID=1404768 RepID=A0A2U8PR67_9BRAD|nr:DNA repair protein [Bradyrhizobium amphicarpaeae]AWM00260.1 DNA repair protein [Bradyrhizobium amphicarpaeae]
MSGARMSALASLRGQIERIETAAVMHPHDRVALGHSEADNALKGGLARAALHEVFCEGRQGPAATGFVMGLAGRVSAQRPLLWIRQDFSEIEAGALSMSGLAELGLDPRRVVTVRAADVESALRSSADALACDALGAVVLELWGDVGQFDLVASRKLTLAAQGSGVTGLMLRMAAQPLPSTAETRWMLRAAHSPPGPVWAAWGAPRFDAELLRNRHGPCGRWIMEWNCDECQFSEPSAYSQPVAATPADRQDPAFLQQRRAG